MEALTSLEIKKTLRGCAVNAADVLAARTKTQLLELAKQHGIGPDVPDEWMMQSLKLKAAKSMHARRPASPKGRRSPTPTSDRQHSRRGTARRSPTNRSSEEEPTGSPTPNSERADSKRGKRPNSPKSKKSKRGEPSSRQRGPQPPNLERSTSMNALDRAKMDMLSMAKAEEALAAVEAEAKAEREGKPSPIKFELGAAVYIPRSHGGESIAFIAAYDAEKAVYKVELDARNSGHYKLATADFLSSVPKGMGTFSAAGMRKV